MIIVSDTSPLIVLAKIGCLQHLANMYGSVYIPPEVEQELSAKSTSQGVPDIMSLTLGWLHVKAPRSIEKIHGIHPGEMAAISLSLELNARLLLIDDEKGRRAATERSIPTIGTVGILETAAEINLLDLTVAFTDLKKTNFRIPHAFLDQRLEFYLQKTKSK